MIDPKMTVVRFDSADVIATSSPTPFALHSANCNHKDAVHGYFGDPATPSTPGHYSFDVYDTEGNVTGTRDISWGDNNRTPAGQWIIWDTTKNKWDFCKLQ